MTLEKTRVREPLATLEVPGFRVREAVYKAAGVVPTEPHTWATICLGVEGGYQVDWGRARLRCNPASLLFQPPGQAYGARTSGEGSRCLTIEIDSGVLLGATGTVPDPERLTTPRRMSPHWLAYELRRELALQDDLSFPSVASTALTLLAELGDRPGLEVRSIPPAWLRRAQEQIEDEFRLPHTLESLARAAGVHRVHLAREFRRRFGCTVGNYVRQRRVAFACHRLGASRDSRTYGSVRGAPSDGRPRSINGPRETSI